MNKKYLCDICGKEFNSKKSKSNHRRWHILPEYKEFQEKSRLYSKETILLKGCSMKGHVTSPKTKAILSKVHMGEKNGMWKGDKIKDKSSPHAHRYIERRKPKPKLCEMCQLVPPYDLANISQEYKRDIDDWEWLCRKCHMIKDGRLTLLHNNNKGKKYGTL